MKKKILSLVMCICVAFGCLFSFAGCSQTNNQNAANEVVLTVNGEEFNRTDVINNFYNFIMNNYVLVYNGTDPSIIEDKFYSNFIKTQIVMEKAEKALEDGTIKYCIEDEDDVWTTVQDYFRSQVDSYEKDIYDEDEDKYPIWLQTQENEEDDEFFESYEKPSDIKKEEKTDEATKLSREEIYEEDSEGNSRFNGVFEAIFNYVSSIEIDEDTEEEIKTYTKIENQEGAQTRRQAYANYMQNLFLNAKAEENSADADELLLDQIVEIYDAAYEAKLGELYQEYCEEVLVLDAPELSEDSIVKVFLQAYNADSQNNLNEADYVSVITGKDTELILYHNNDKFFTVQHILLKFDETVLSMIQEDDFYVDMSKNDVQLELFEQFMKNREDIVEQYYPNLDDYTTLNGTIEDYIAAGALTDINEEQLKKMPTYAAEIDEYLEYFKYSNNQYVRADANTEGAKRMISTYKVIEFYNDMFDRLMGGEVASVLFDEENLNGQNEDIKFILEAVVNMKKAGASMEEIEAKVSSLIFIQLSWIMSDDGLYNTIYKQLGYVMANYPDENNNFSHEFVDLSKMLYDGVSQGTIDITDVSASSNVVITKDGVHVIKLDNIFKEGSIIDISGVDTTNTAEVIKLMKQTYVCNGSDQTVYDYYYDMVYKTLAGSEDKAGSYFENLKNEWLQEYLNDNKISYENKLAYEEMMSELY